MINNLGAQVKIKTGLLAARSIQRVVQGLRA